MIVVIIRHSSVPIPNTTKRCVFFMNAKMNKHKMLTRHSAFGINLRPVELLGYEFRCGFIVHIIARWATTSSEKIIIPMPNMIVRCVFLSVAKNKNRLHIRDIMTFDKKM